jgi:hypothetical protein
MACSICRKPGHDKRNCKTFERRQRRRDLVRELEETISRGFQQGLPALITGQSMSNVDNVSWKVQGWAVANIDLLSALHHKCREVYPKLDTKLSQHDQYLRVCEAVYRLGYPSSTELIAMTPKAVVGLIHVAEYKELEAWLDKNEDRERIIAMAKKFEGRAWKKLLFPTIRYLADPEGERHSPSLRIVDGPDGYLQLVRLDLRVGHPLGR